jgi:hypothetical protein
MAQYRDLDVDITNSVYTALFGQDYYPDISVEQRDALTQALTRMAQDLDDPERQRDAAYDYEVLGSLHRIMKASIVDCRSDARPGTAARDDLDKCSRQASEELSVLSVARDVLDDKMFGDDVLVNDV